MKVQILHKDDTPLAVIGTGNNAIKPYIQCGVINNTLHSMFDDLSVYLDDIELSNANKLYPFKSYWLDYFDTTEEQKKSYMSAQMWYNEGSDKNSFNST